MQLRSSGSRAGFTLMEMLVYLALLALLMGGALLTAYNLLSDAGGTRTKINTDEEANFLLRKIDWALADATTVTTPAAGASGGTLRVSKSSYGSNPIVFDLAGSALEISQNGGAAQPLSSSNVTVANLVFAVSTGTPPAVKASFDVNGRSYSLTKYLRQ